VKLDRMFDQNIRALDECSKISCQASLYGFKQSIKS
jgi:hypothetical protein